MTKRNDNFPDILRRMFEPLPYDHDRRFEIGDQVSLARPTLFGRTIPVGAAGIVRKVEREGVMADKGRPYFVEFDLKPYSVPMPADLKEMLKKYGEDAPEYHVSMSTNLGVHDLQAIHNDREKKQRHSRAVYTHAASIIGWALKWAHWKPGAAVVPTEDDPQVVSHHGIYCILGGGVSSQATVQIAPSALSNDRQHTVLIFNTEDYQRYGGRSQAVFSEATIDALRTMIGDLGYKILDEWNGAGYVTASFQIDHMWSAGMRAAVRDNRAVKLPKGWRA